jgi:hypothetical protein
MLKYKNIFHRVHYEHKSSVTCAARGTRNCFCVNVKYILSVFLTIDDIQKDGITFKCSSFDNGYAIAKTIVNYTYYIGIAGVQRLVNLFILI